MVTSECHIFKCVAWKCVLAFGYRCDFSQPHRLFWIASIVIVIDFTSVIAWNSIDFWPEPLFLVQFNIHSPFSFWLRRKKYPIYFTVFIAVLFFMYMYYCFHFFSFQFIVCIFFCKFFLEYKGAKNQSLLFIENDMNYLVDIFASNLP